jgi:uncharacterized membrane protein YbhN (UPF0104 family)
VTASPFPRTRRRERLGIALRAAVGLGLLALLVRKVGWASLAPVLASPHGGFLAVSALFSVLLIGVSCLKWQILLRERRVRVGFARLFGLYLVGMLFNNFLPSNVGGDLVRSIGLGPSSSSASPGSSRSSPVPGPVSSSSPPSSPSRRSPPGSCSPRPRSPARSGCSPTTGRSAGSSC